MELFSLLVHRIFNEEDRNDDTLVATNALHVNATWDQPKNDYNEERRSLQNDQSKSDWKELTVSV